MPLPSRNAARLTGYAVILVISGVVAGFGAFVFRDAVRAPVVLVHFPELATLAEGDPVVERGVPIGAIERITREDGLPIAELRFFHHRTFAEDTRFLNLSHSLMGARKVWVVPGTSPIPLNAARVQAGEFVPGLPETLHKVEALAGRVARLRATADSLLAAGDAAATLLEPLDAAGAALAALAASLEEGPEVVRAGLQELANDLTAAAGAVRKAHGATEAATSRAGNGLAAAARAEAPLTRALIALETLTAALADTAGPTRLLTDRGPYDSLLRGLRTLDSATRILKTGGLGDEMKIKPRLRAREAPAQDAADGP